MIESMNDLQTLVRAGETDWQQYGEVRTVYEDGLILFNYKARALYRHVDDWNWFEKVSRGLILNTSTGEVVARPFDKFFNYREGVTNSEITDVIEKKDGSLGICYWHNGKPKIATRGSFGNRGGQLATSWLQHNVSWDTLKFYSNLTLLFEIIDPENRIVVDYGDYLGLILIGARNRHTGEEVSEHILDVLAEELDVKRPRRYDIQTFGELLASAKHLTANEEGFVIRCANGSRWKIKGDRYLDLAGSLTGLGYRRVLTAIKDGFFDELIELVPDEFLTQVREWEKIVEDTIAVIENDSQRALDDYLDRKRTARVGSSREDRKAYAQWVQSMIVPDRQDIMYALAHGKPLRPLILKQMLLTRQETQ